MQIKISEDSRKKLRDVCWKKSRALQGFPQVLRTWGWGGGGWGSSKFDEGGGLKSIHGGTWVGGGFKCCQKIPVKEFI